MGFQLSNGEGTSSTTPNTNTYKRGISNQEHSYSNDDSDFIDDSFDPAAEDTVFIANRYAQSAPINTSTSSSSYLSQRETFPPFLMFVGAALQILAMVVLIQQLHSESMIATMKDIINQGETQSIYSSLSSVYLLNILSYISILVDSIILCKKKMTGGSIIFWAIIFPPVYYFKRCRANDNPNIIAFLILIATFGLSGYATYSSMTAVVTAMGIEMNESGFSGASMALARIDTLEQMYVSFDDGRKISYSQLIASNITEPTYSYIEATSTEPALFSIKSTTPYGGQIPIVINFDYNTMAPYSMTVGDKNYTTQFGIFYYLLEN